MCFEMIATIMPVNISITSYSYTFFVCVLVRTFKGFPGSASLPVQDTQVQSLGWEGHGNPPPWRRGMATHSSILA